MLSKNEMKKGHAFCDVLSQFKLCLGTKNDIKMRSKKETQKGHTFFRFVDPERDLNGTQRPQIIKMGPPNGPKWDPKRVQMGTLEGIHQHMLGQGVAKAP